MNIVVLLTDFFDAIGGIQTFNRCLVNALDKIGEERDLRATLLVLNDPEVDNISSRYFNPVRTKYLSFGGSRTRFIASAIYQSINASIIIFGHVNFTPLATAIRLLCPKLKMLLTVYGLDVTKRLPLLQWLGVKQINKVLSISASTKEQMLSLNGFDKNRFDIFPCALDPFYNKNTISRTREELFLPQGKMILTVSRLEAHDRYKNIDLVIQAMPAILKEIPDAFYVIVGDGSGRLRLENLTSALGLSDKVIFTGQVSNSLLPAYYQSCNIFVLPSLGEGFGIVFLEAMYYAKPCIGARAGGIPEVITEGKTGFLTEPGNIKSLTQAIVKLLSDESLCYRMGFSGKDKLQQELSYELFCKRLERILCF